MAEVTVTVEAILAKTTNTKSLLLSGTPTATSDTITFDASTMLAVTGGIFTKVISATAWDGSTGMPKAISGNGSNILTTRGWVTGDNKWFIRVDVLNDLGV